MNARLVANEHQLHIEEFGVMNEPTVVLLHHGLGSTASWMDLIPELVASGYRVIAYDRWGYGRSQARKELSIPNFLEDIEDLNAIADKFCETPFSIIGHSDGGTLGLYYASYYPEKVNCLICIAAHIYVEPKMIEGIEAVYQRYQSDKHFQRGMKRVHQQNYPNIFNAWYSGWTKSENLKWDLRPRLSEIECPCLIIQGCLDEHATVQHAIDLAEAIVDSQLWLIDNIGHMVLKEAAHDVKKGILSFLEKKCSIKS